MATPLLSRFDLVILLLDEQNKEWDNKVCDFILRGVSDLRVRINARIE